MYVRTCTVRRYPQFTAYIASSCKEAYICGITEDSVRAGLHGLHEDELEGGGVETGLLLWQGR